MNATEMWKVLVGQILISGEEVSPRGRLTKELPQHTIEVDMRRPVVTVAARKVSYKFMAAEALWILTGDDRVEPVAKYNPRIAQFSDDGATFFGAYGPRIHEQLDYVVAKLLEDRDTRQAVLTTWRQNPPKTKDVPCTIAFAFSIRHNLLNLHVFMRSSDAWLGIPYDVFTFSMLAHLVCCRLRPQHQLQPGTLWLTAASSHLYAPDWVAANDIVFNRNNRNIGDIAEQAYTPIELWTDERVLYRWLSELRDTEPGNSLRWWES